MLLWTQVKPVTFFLFMPSFTSWSELSTLTFTLRKSPRIPGNLSSSISVHSSSSTSAMLSLPPTRNTGPDTAWEVCQRQFIVGLVRFTWELKQNEARETSAFHTDRLLYIMIWYLLKHWKVTLFCLRLNVVQFWFWILCEGQHHHHFH